MIVQACLNGSLRDRLTALVEDGATLLRGTTTGAAAVLARGGAEIGGG